MTCAAYHCEGLTCQVEAIAALLGQQQQDLRLPCAAPTTSSYALAPCLRRAYGLKVPLEACDGSIKALAPMGIGKGQLVGLQGMRHKLQNIAPGAEDEELGLGVSLGEAYHPAQNCLNLQRQGHGLNASQM